MTTKKKYDPYDDAYVFGKHWARPSRNKIKNGRAVLLAEYKKARSATGHGQDTQVWCLPYNPVVFYIGVLAEVDKAGNEMPSYVIASVPVGVEQAHSLVHSIAHMARGIAAGVEHYLPAFADSIVRLESCN